MIYTIRRTDFDNMENNFDSAVSVQDIGATESRDLANKLLDKYRESAKPYRGWDKCTYPEFHVVVVSQLDTSDLGRTCSAVGHRWDIKRRPTPTCCGTRICTSCGSVEYPPPEKA